MNLSVKQLEAVNCPGSLCLSAGAGTGKTLTLVAKYLKCLEETKSSRNILALTFTDKAAAEMRERIRKALISQGGDGVDERLEDLSWSTIETFHAFCNQIIRDFPLETGVDPSFAVIDDAMLNVIINDASKKIIESSDPGVAEAVARIMAAVGVNRTGYLFKSLYGKRFLTDRFLAATLDGDARAALAASRDQLLRDSCWLLATDPKVLSILEGFREIAGKHPDEDFLARATGDLGILCGDPGREAAIDSIIRFYDAIPPRYSGSTKVLQDDREQFRALLKAFKEEYKRYKIKEIRSGELASMDDRVIEFLTSLRTVNSTFLREVNRQKRERNSIDYDDMIAAVNQLFVKDPEFVRKYLSSRFKYVLIDETQDTDQVQLDIVKAILGSSKERSDGLFVVGDPKQSIYFFRDVDVSLYKETREHIVSDLGGTYLPLDQNHRSAPQIVGFVNAIFAKLMSRDARPWEFKYESVDVSPKRRDHKGSVALHLIDINDPTSEARKVAEGNLVASNIDEAVKSRKPVYHERPDGTYEIRPAEFKDMAVLLRRRTNIFYYERALRMAGIPYRVHRGQDFFSRQEVLDLYLVLRFLNDPDDDVALYGALRSPYFGLSDSQLHLIGMAGEGPWYKRLEAASKGDGRLAGIKNKLELWMNYARWEPVGDLTSRIVAESNIHAVYGGLANGPEMRANVEKLRDKLRNLQSGGFVSLADAVEGLSNSINEEQKEGGVQIEGDKDAVLLITIHSAKGMEWPIVIVPEADSKLKPNETETVEVDRKLGLGVKVIDPETLDLQPDAVMMNIKRQWTLKSEAEFQRLMYVAMTRARDHLVITGVAQWVEPPKDPIMHGDCWFHFLCGALNLGPGDVRKGMRYYGDSSMVGGTMRIYIVPPNTEGSWKEGDEYTVPEWLKKVPMESVVQWQEPQTRKINPSKIAAAEEDGSRDDDEEEDDEYENQDNKEYGIIVHSVFQGRPASVVLREHGIDDEKMAQEIDEMYARFLASDLMKDVVEIHKEISYTGGRVDADEDGQIDCLVKKTDGSWIIIDYKTGSPSDMDLEGKRERYANQMRAYSKAVKDMIGVEPKAFLYFTHNGKVVEM